MVIFKRLIENTNISDWKIMIIYALAFLINLYFIFT